jgi:hypothetical protein
MEAPPSRLKVGSKMPANMPLHLPTMDGTLVPLLLPPPPPSSSKNGSNNNNDKVITVLCFLRHLA